MFLANHVVPHVKKVVQAVKHKTNPHITPAQHRTIALHTRVSFAPAPAGRTIAIRTAGLAGMGKAIRDWRFDQAMEQMFRGHGGGGGGGGGGDGAGSPDGAAMPGYDGLSSSGDGAAMPSAYDATGALAPASNPTADYAAGATPAPDAFLSSDGGPGPSDRASTILDGSDAEPADGFDVGGIHVTKKQATVGGVILGALIAAKLIF